MKTEINPIPIIFFCLSFTFFLSACDHEANIVLGLDGGGDDYLTKPFRIRELVSRIHAVLRRRSAGRSAADWPAGPESGADELVFGPIRMWRLREDMCPPRCLGSVPTRVTRWPIG